MFETQLGSLSVGLENMTISSLRLIRSSFQVDLSTRLNIKLFGDLFLFDFISFNRESTVSLLENRLFLGYLQHNI